MAADLPPQLILVDTSGYFALADRTDQHHRSAVTFALMARMQISTAFAFDIHFRQYGRYIVVPEAGQG